MSLIGDIVSRVLQPIVDAIKKALGPFGKLFDLISKFFTGFRDSFNKGLALSTAIITEIHEWRNFKEDFRVKQRVINLPTAIDKSQELLDKIVEAWHAIVDLAKEIQKQAKGQTEDPTAEAEEAVSDIEQSGVKTILEKFPKLAKGLEKLLGFLAVAVGVLESIQNAIDDLTKIVAAITGIREEIETGSTIFLQQNNQRRTVHLDDGTVMKIRVGNLHS